MDHVVRNLNLVEGFNASSKQRTKTKIQKKKALIVLF